MLINDSQQPIMLLLQIMVLFAAVWIIYKRRSSLKSSDEILSAVNDFMFAAFKSAFAMGLVLTSLTYVMWQIANWLKPAIGCWLMLFISVDILFLLLFFLIYAKLHHLLIPGDSPAENPATNSAAIKGGSLGFLLLIMFAFVINISLTAELFYRQQQIKQAIKPGAAALLAVNFLDTKDISAAEAAKLKQTPNLKIDEETLAEFKAAKPVDFERHNWAQYFFMHALDAIQPIAPSFEYLFNFKAPSRQGFEAVIWLLWLQACGVILIAAFCLYVIVDFITTEFINNEHNRY